ncbi:substrate-binding domain-containing protein [Phytoactinopolyspora mesophila]|uniref:ABC transporter substrate-binding protein n=1 Tax=Phytoactinopolyspora mesophila TaxID=2650750 RepID=A0A7K3M911_9ACTN|nr:substrate-binding domain-containing protein [Phytoactinopolyspora mesophila]NDL59690.1 ABC transporter substrate-binding protein [Phytoactinopolyspora mesophila]
MSSSLQHHDDVSWRPEPGDVPTDHSVYRAPILRIRPSEHPRSRSTAVNVGLVIPMHGPAGIFGLSCIACSVLAGEEINAEGGLLGREVRLVPIDGAGNPEVVAGRVVELVRDGQVDAITGWHLSHVRRALAAHLHGEVPYVYSSLYEGGEHAPGVFMAGETPDQQIAPAMAWLAREMGVRRWAVVGDDYLWPRGSASAVRRFVGDFGLQLTDEIFVPLGQHNFDRVISRLRSGSAQGVLMLLVGQDAVHFNRAFAETDLDERLVRLSPLMDENMLLASGPEAGRQLYSAAGYFGALATEDALDLLGRYVRRFGPDAPVLNSMGESCYEALRLLATLVRQARSLDVRSMSHTAESPVGYHGPRGSVHLRDHHLMQRVYLARADGTVYDVVTQL